MRDPIKRKFFKTFEGIIARCYDPKHIAFPRYGAKGTGSKWKSFSDFKRDMWESYLRHIATFGSSNTTIERLDNARGYEKENCRWATWDEQAHNRSNVRFILMNGESKTIRDWCKAKGLNEKSIYNRICSLGWSPEVALNTPIGQRGKGRWTNFKEAAHLKNHPL